MQGLVKEVYFEPLTRSVLFLPILISLLGFMRSILLIDPRKSILGKNQTKKSPSAQTVRFLKSQMSHLLPPFIQMKKTNYSKTNIKDTAYSIHIVIINIALKQLPFFSLK